MREGNRAKQIKAGLENAAEIKRQRESLSLSHLEKNTVSKKKPIDVVHVISADDAKEALDTIKGGYDEYQEKEEELN